LEKTYGNFPMIGKNVSNGWKNIACRIPGGFPGWPGRRGAGASFLGLNGTGEAGIVAGVAGWRCAIRANLHIEGEEQ
jgi:hypothetical protein